VSPLSYLTSMKVHIGFTIVLLCILMSLSSLLSVTVRCVEYSGGLGKAEIGYEEVLQSVNQSKVIDHLKFLTGFNQT